MKNYFSKFICSALLVLTLAVTAVCSACGEANEETDHPDNQSQETEAPSGTSVEDMEREAHGDVDDAETTESTETSETESTEQETKSENQLLKSLEEQYDAIQTYQDELVSYRYLILGKTSLVSTTIVGGIASTAAVPYTEIARNDQTDVGDLSYLFFYDKNNQAQQFTCKTKTAKKILEKIQDLSNPEK